MKKNLNCSYRTIGTKLATLYFWFRTTFAGKVVLVGALNGIVRARVEDGRDGLKADKKDRFLGVGVEGARLTLRSECS